MRRKVSPSFFPLYRNYCGCETFPVVNLNAYLWSCIQDVDFNHEDIKQFFITISMIFSHFFYLKGGKYFQVIKAKVYNHE